MPADGSDLLECYQLAEEWLQNNIEAEVTESCLMKRYSLTKSPLWTLLAAASAGAG